MHLLDTNALSEPIRKRPSTEFMKRLEAARGEPLLTSVICVMEIRYGCARHAQGEKLWRRIEESILKRVEVLPVDQPIAERAGELLAALHRGGRPPSTEDLLIAATGLVRGLTVVTHNVRDFDHIPGLKTADWTRG